MVLILYSSSSWLTLISFLSSFKCSKTDYSVGSIFNPTCNSSCDMYHVLEQLLSHYWQPLMTMMSICLVHTTTSLHRHVAPITCISEHVCFPCTVMHICFWLTMGLNCSSKNSTTILHRRCHSENLSEVPGSLQPPAWGGKFAKNLEADGVNSRSVEKDTHAYAPSWRSDHVTLFSSIYFLLNYTTHSSKIKNIFQCH
jgi:hypothetical protein